MESVPETQRMDELDPTWQFRVVLLAFWGLGWNVNTHLLGTEVSLGRDAAVPKSGDYCLKPLRHSLSVLVEQLSVHIVDNVGGNVDQATPTSQRPQADL